MPKDQQIQIKRRLTLRQNQGRMQRIACHLQRSLREARGLAFQDRAKHTQSASEAAVQQLSRYAVNAGEQQKVARNARQANAAGKLLLLVGKTERS